MASDISTKGPTFSLIGPNLLGPIFCLFTNALLLKVPGPTYFNYYARTKKNRKIIDIKSSCEAGTLDFCPVLSVNSLISLVKKGPSRFSSYRDLFSKYLILLRFGVPPYDFGGTTL